MSDVETHTVRPGAGELRGRAREWMPQLTDELAELVAIPSVSEAGYPECTRPELRRAHEKVLTLFRDAGCEDFISIELPDTAPMADLFGRLATVQGITK